MSVHEGLRGLLAVFFFFSCDCESCLNRLSFGGQTLRDHSCGLEVAVAFVSAGLEGTAQQSLELCPALSYGDRLGVLGVFTAAGTEEFVFLDTVLVSLFI